MTALLLACGALAREVLELRKRHGWDAEVKALPASLHNRPERIPDAVERRVEAQDADYDPVVVVYGDCGTGGQLQAMLAARGWHGLAAPHCYALYAGEREFAQMMQEEPGTFYLTDYLAASFDHLVLEGLGLEQHPELRQEYFEHYRRIVYLQQRADDRLVRKARQAAEALGLPLEIRHTGLGGLERELIRLMGASRSEPEAAATRGERITDRPQQEAH